MYQQIHVAPTLLTLLRLTHHIKIELPIPGDRDNAQ